MDDRKVTVKPADNFMLTAKKELIDNKKAIVLGIASCWAICILMGLLMGYNGSGGGIIEVSVFCVMFSITGCIVGSLTFSNMKSKESRINALMLPASTFNKFIVRWIAVVPALFLIMLAGFYIGDLTRIFVNWALDTSAQYRHYIQVTDLWVILSFGYEEEGGIILTNVLLSYFVIQSIYIFGAILWPKLSFIKTLVALWVVQTVFSIILISLGRNFCFSLNFTGESAVWCITIAQIIILLGFYTLTYLRFKKSQVVYKLF